MRLLPISALLAVSLCPTSIGQILTDEEARTDRIVDQRVQEERDEIENEIQPLESRLNGIENDLYEWRDPTAPEVQTMREKWSAANPLKTSFDMPDFTRQKIRVLRTDAAAAEQQAAAQLLQDRIAALEARLQAIKGRQVMVTPAPTEGLQEREAAHEYAVQAEIDRQKRNAMASKLGGDAPAPNEGLATNATLKQSDQSKIQTQRDAAYDRTFEASETRAAKLYAFANDPKSDGGKRMLEVEGDLLANGDPLYYDPNKPLIIAQMVAKELRIAPRHIPIVDTEIGAAVVHIPAGSNSREIDSNGSSAGVVVSAEPTPPARQPQTETGSRDHSGLRIVVASYGAENTFRDVTSFVQIAINNGGLTANSSSLGGDPIFGKVKTLKVVYEYEGHICEREFAENSEVKLSPTQ